jgi:nucleoside diphosphate kinase
MSALNVVAATESLINGLVASMVAGRRSTQVGDSPRTIQAVRLLISQLEMERAARATVEEENAVLRQQVEELAALVMRMRDHLSGD